MLPVTEKSTTPREPIPAKVHIAVCNSIIDLGVQTKTYNNQPAKQVREVLIGWELPYETIDVEGEKVPRIISRTYTMSLNEKARLRKDIESWLGRALSLDELRCFNLTSMVAKPCQLQVVHTQRNGNTYANINNIMSLPDNMPIPAPTQVVIFGLDDKDAMETVNLLPEWIQKRIKEGITWQEMQNRADRPLWGDNDAIPAPSDEDVPF